MSLRKTLIFIATQQGAVKVALFTSVAGIVLAFVSVYLYRDHFLSSVLAMVGALVAAALSARESLDVARKSKLREREQGMD